MAAKITAREARNKAYAFVAIPDDEGYDILFPDLPGVTSWAASIDEVAANVKEALDVTFEAAERAGWLVPAPAGYPEDGIVRLDGEQRPERDPAGPLLSASDVAERLGISRRQLNAKAQKLGVGRFIGSQRVFTEAEIDLVRPRPTRGRPPRIKTRVAS